MLGLCSVTFRNKSVDKIISLAKQAELDVIEWGSDIHVPQTDLLNAQKVATKMKDAGLVSNSYGTYYRLGTFSDFDTYLQVAKILGVSTLRVWAGDQDSADVPPKKRQQIIEDANRLGELAREVGCSISIEYHADTLTDTPESALKLMEEIKSDNVFLYWQPAERLTVEERIESLPKLGTYITNVHVFNWENYKKRFPLDQAADSWKQYITLVKKYSPHDQDFLIEFVPGDDPIKGFFETVETLKQIV